MKTLEAILAGFGTRSQFIAIHEYSSSTEDMVADYSILWHVNYIRAIKKSLEILEKFQPTEEKCLGKPWTLLELSQAKEELIQSFKDTLSGYNSRYTARDAYQPIIVDGKVIPGVKKDNSGNIHLFDCYVIHTRIIHAGERKIVKSSSFILAKKFLRKLCPVSKYRQFRLKPDQFKKLSIGGVKIDREFFEKVEITP